MNVQVNGLDIPNVDAMKEEYKKAPPPSSCSVLPYCNVCMYVGCEFTVGSGCSGTVNKPAELDLGIMFDDTIKCMKMGAPMPQMPNACEQVEFFDMPSWSDIKSKF